ncbi:MAG: hypothetical protein DMG21_18740 [Acidobacteria bacterium]|nr:MAG: hypothetical protein DMG21_18740 [Acidobacteriota bacterium]
MAHRILSYEFKQGWFPKVVPALESYVLMYQGRMVVQMGPQARCVACIEKVHGTAECGVFNSLTVR